MTSEELDKLEALFKAATKGPWIVRGPTAAMIERGLDIPTFIQAPRENPRHPYDIEILGDDDTLYSTKKQDMEFIVAMQNNFESLIATARKGIK